jgi:hypothetical protein
MKRTSLPETRFTPANPTRWGQGLTAPAPTPRERPSVGSGLIGGAQTPHQRVLSPGVVQQRQSETIAQHRQEHAPDLLRRGDPDQDEIPREYCSYRADIPRPYFDPLHSDHIADGLDWNHCIDALGRRCRAVHARRLHLRCSERSCYSGSAASASHSSSAARGLSRNARCVFV